MTGDDALKLRVLSDLNVDTGMDTRKHISRQFGIKSDHQRVKPNEHTV